MYELLIGHDQAYTAQLESARQEIVKQGQDKDIEIVVIGCGGWEPITVYHG
jgi:hypothetical protein